MVQLGSRKPFKCHACSADIADDVEKQGRAGVALLRIASMHWMSAPSLQTVKTLDLQRDPARPSCGAHATPRPESALSLPQSHKLSSTSRKVIGDDDESGPYQ
jgi:hypothetical protein